MRRRSRRTPENAPAEANKQSWERRDSGSRARRSPRVDARPHEPSRQGRRCTPPVTANAGQQRDRTERRSRGLTKGKGQQSGEDGIGRLARRDRRLGEHPLHEGRARRERRRQKAAEERDENARATSTPRKRSRLTTLAVKIPRGMAAANLSVCLKADCGRVLLRRSRLVRGRSGRTAMGNERLCHRRCQPRGWLRTERRARSVTAEVTDLDGARPADSERQHGRCKISSTQQSLTTLTIHRSHYAIALRSFS